MAHPTATCGPFVVELLECQRMLGYHIYHVSVVGKDGEHYVRRRFDDFAALREGTSMRAAELPEMPGRICGRNSRRTERLGEILAAVMRRDPHAIMPETRRFLGVGAVSSILVVSPSELREVMKLTSVACLGPLAEDEEGPLAEDDENEDQDCRWPSCANFSTWPSYGE